MSHSEVFLKFMGVHMFMVMALAMFAKLGGVAEAARQVVVFVTPMEVDVQVKGDEQHAKRHEERPYLEYCLFHGA